MPPNDDSYRITPLEERHARDILRWRYPAPYDFYDPPEDEHGDHYVSQFLNPAYQFHAVLNHDASMIGFCSYGIDGQVPGGDYDELALDIGLGMKPEFTGLGNGADFFAAILRYAEQNLSAERIRLTVAKFNQRAMKLYGNFGFELDNEFFGTISNVPYNILIRRPSNDEAIL
ncbi:MAG: ribosomal-protein-alanine N-acetyltransferase [Candidatus Azotimanducaceae bacterium]